MTKLRKADIIIALVKIAFALVIIFPILIALEFSLQSEGEILSTKITWFTTTPTLENFEYVLTKTPILNYLKNTFIVCFIVIISQVILASMAAYAFVFFKFPGKGLLFTLIISTMMIPSEVTVISNFTKIQQWGLTDTYTGLVLPSLISGMAIFQMRQFYMTLPMELKEASEIDGCSDMRFLFAIAVPLSKPAIASLAIYQFIHIYNQYFWPLIVTNTDKMRTVQIGISMLNDAELTRFGIILAGVVLAIIPGIFVMSVGQEYLIKGMTAGSVKG